MPIITDETRIEIIATIDELNQYLRGNVTNNSILDTLKELHAILAANN
jgi:hypothetical protein